ncbi:uncharacterized protein LOC133813930 [Humulus lupulus]|uniref:uncharacterized protein LOC133813930 n=1 Tax=Humulus lupulus TaxID=3486 RepID=UPI002B4107AA|nr:uncharacterized protein LOC133813930 [Humulus lupulus]
MHYLKRKKGKEGYMTLKLDMSKTYDRVEWAYLLAIMSKMGFHDRWVDLVLYSVSSISYKIINGGREMGPIFPSRGIRQEDPLSPYLFIICAEGLSALIRKYEAQKWIHGIKVDRGASMVSHMFFAYDNYLYCKAIDKEARRVMEILHKFERASGQQVNVAKSSVFFSSNTEIRKRINVCQSLGMHEANAQSTYVTS